MSAKIQCPSCKKTLKEVNDLGKQAHGEYRVYDSISFGEPAGIFRAIECLACGIIRRVDDWMNT